MYQTHRRDNTGCSLRLETKRPNRRKRGFPGRSGNRARGPGRRAAPQGLLHSALRRLARDVTTRYSKPATDSVFKVGHPTSPTPRRASGVRAHLRLGVSPREPGVIRTSGLTRERRCALTVEERGSDTVERQVRSASVAGMTETDAADGWTAKPSPGPAPRCRTSRRIHPLSGASQYPLH